MVTQVQIDLLKQVFPTLTEDSDVIKTVTSKLQLEETATPDIILNAARNKFVAQINEGEEEDQDIGQIYSIFEGTVIPPQKPLEPGKFVYIFDFDETLTLSHTYKQDEYYRGLDPEFVKNNVRRLNEFKRFVLDAISKGHRIAIATFSNDNWLNRADNKGGIHLIRHYLSVIFADHPEVVDQIIIQAFNIDNSNKVPHIENIQDALDADVTQYVYIDDEPKNINVELDENKNCWLITETNEEKIWKRLQASLEDPSIIANPMTIKYPSSQNITQHLIGLLKKTYDNDTFITELLPFWELIPMSNKVKACATAITTEMTEELPDTDKMDTGATGNHIEKQIPLFYLRDKEILDAICFDEETSEKFFSHLFLKLKKDVYLSIITHFILELLSNTQPPKQHVLQLNNLYNELKNAELYTLASFSLVPSSNILSYELKLKLLEQSFLDLAEKQDGAEDLIKQIINDDLFAYNRIINRDEYDYNNIFLEILTTYSSYIQTCLANGDLLFDISHITNHEVAQKILALWRAHFKINPNTTDEDKIKSYTDYLYLEAVSGDIQQFSAKLKELKDYFNEKLYSALCKNIIAKLLQYQPINKNVLNCILHLQAEDLSIKKEFGKQIIACIYNINNEGILTTLLNQNIIPNPHKSDLFKYLTPPHNSKTLTATFVIARANDDCFTKELYEKVQGFLPLNLLEKLKGRILKIYPDYHFISWEELLKIAIQKQNTALMQDILQQPHFQVTDELFDLAWKTHNILVIMKLLNSFKLTADTLWTLVEDMFHFAGSTQTFMLFFTTIIFKGSIDNLEQKNKEGLTLIEVMLQKCKTNSDQYHAIVLWLAGLGAKLPNATDKFSPELFQLLQTRKTAVRSINYSDAPATHKTILCAMAENDLAAVTNWLNTEENQALLKSEPDLAMEVFRKALENQSWLICQKLSVHVKQRLIETKDPSIALQLLDYCIKMPTTSYTFIYSVEMLVFNQLNDYFKDPIILKTLFDQIRRNLPSITRQNQQMLAIFLEILKCSGVDIMSGINNQDKTLRKMFYNFVVEINSFPNKNYKNFLRSQSIQLNTTSPIKVLTPGPGFAIPAPGPGYRQNNQFQPAASSNNNNENNNNNNNNNTQQKKHNDGKEEVVDADVAHQQQRRKVGS